MKLNKKNRQNDYLNKLFNKSFIVLSLVLAFSLGQNLSAQDSAFEKKVYKPKTSKAKPEPTPKKVTPPKATPKKVEPKRTPKRTRPKRTRNTTLITISTSVPQQEVWLGNDSLGTTDEDGKLELWLKKGNYLVSLRKPDSEETLSSKLITITSKNDEFTLESEVAKEVVDSKEPTAEQVLQDQLKEALDAAEKIKDILIRYGDPLKTNTVTLSDWEFVYQTAQANSLNNFTAIQIEAQRWFSSGQIDLAKGNYANAYGNFTKAIEYMPDSAYPYYALGEAYTANKQIADALTAYQKAVQINPKFALAHRKIGDIHLNSNRSKEAVISLETALANGFNTPAVRFDLGKAYLRNKDWDKASKELELVVKEAPTGDVYMTLGDLYLELKRNISAYEAYKKSTELSPDSAKGFYKLGEILFNEREFEKAKVAFEQSLALDEKGKQINVNQAKKLVREAAQKLK